ncbi:DAK2 domain-containing protein [Bacillus gobiensis]|uniref:DAK2 domain-containing protein n=1 Tax=Bacillus gobiensis TaxID=1441095 RepID=UPI003D19EC2D
MAIERLDGKAFADMILSGAHNLSQNADVVDALNVFPVPDGDTGTNMNLSMTSGAKEVEMTDSDHIGQVAKNLSKGLLMGARGNSGVILSQLFRGFGKSIEQEQTIDSVQFARAFQAGVDTAYKAVMKPVEGTILTVAKDAAKKAISEAENEKDIIKIMETVAAEAASSLKRTPDLLPVLKEVGVVDSGGQGLVYVYQGFLASLKGEKLSKSDASLPSLGDLVKAEHHKSAQSHMSTEDIEFGYCTEFMVKLEDEKEPFNEEKFREDLSQFGDSLLVIADESLAKVHIHAEHPGEALNYGQTYGSLVNIKIENMREQHTSLLNKQTERTSRKEKNEYGIVTVAMGDGITELFKSLGASSVIEGGQTMNPSTEDILEAVKQANAKTVYILPNNSNIVMAANQAASVLEEKVFVIPTKNVPQGMSALLAFNPDTGPADNENRMNEAINHVKAGQVTYSVRDTQIDGHQIKKDDYMGIMDGKIVATAENHLEAAKSLLEKMIDGDDEIVTIIVGQDVAENETEDLASFANSRFEEMEVEIHHGNQPLYSYIIAVE